MFVSFDTNSKPKRQTMQKPISNSALIKRLANNDIMREAFILSAIDNYSRLVIDNDPIKHGLINGDYWLALAKDIQKELNAR